VADQHEQINQSLTALRLYLAEQEKVVQETVEGWNDQLRELNMEVAKAYDEKEALLRENVIKRNENRALLMTIVDLQRLLDMHQDKLARADLLYQKTTSQYKAEIITMRFKRDSLIP
jgi:hypothetical protein